MANDLSIGALTLDIESNSSNASTNLDKLANSLLQLRASAKGGANLNPVAKNLGLTATALERINNNSIENLKSLHGELQGISLINGKGFNSAVNGLKKIPDALTGLDSISDTKVALRIRSLVGALSGLSDIPKTNLGSTINSLAKIPKIFETLKSVDLEAFGRKINEVTLAIKPLAIEMDKVARGFSAFPNKIQKLIAGNTSLAKSNKVLGFSFGGLKAKVLGSAFVFRIISDKLTDMITETNSYIENLNLFTASMGEYAGEAKRYAETVGEVMGIDPGEWMRNQGVFMTLAEGFGVASKKAYEMSTNLTELGYDLSSFFNIPFEESMQKLQSGLSGELEPLRRLGYDLSQTRLQAIALENGITKSFNAMTQAEKSQLRYHAIMTQVVKSHGDMARTLNAPANQLRILRAQVTQTSRAFGNLFIPVLNATLPYVIAVTKVARALADILAGLFNIELPEVDYSTLEDSNKGIGSLEDKFADANKQAKELKKTILGIDELNLMADNKPDKGLDGLGGGFGGDLGLKTPDYDFLAGVTSNRVDEIVNSMKDWLGITEDIDSWSDLFKTRLGGILITVGLIGGALATWKISKGVLNFINSLGSAHKNIQMLITSFDKIKPVLGIFASVAASIVGVSSYIGGVVDAVKNGIDWLNAFFITAGATLGGAGIGGLIGSAIGSVGGPLGAGIGALVGLAVGAITDVGILMYQHWDEITAYTKEKWESVTNWFSEKWGEVADWFSEKWGNVTDWFSEKWDSTGEWFSSVGDKIKGKASEIWEKIADSTTFHNLSVLATGTWEIIKTAWSKASEWFSEKWDKIKESCKEMWDDISLKASDTWENVKETWGEITGWFSEKWDIVSGKASEVWKNFKVGAQGAWDGIKSVFSTVGSWFESTFSTAWGKVKDVFSPIGESFVKIKDGIVSSFKIVVNKLIDGINKVVAVPFNGINRSINKIRNAEILGFKPFSDLRDIGVPTIPKLATGGVVDKGQLFIAREAGAELVGNMGGKTTVANNQQIVEGIEQAAERGFTRAIMSFLASGGSTHTLIIKNEHGDIIDEIKLANKRAGYTVVPVAD